MPFEFVSKCTLLMERGSDNFDISVNGATDDETDTSGVTYFVDEEGRYYYQPAGVASNLVSITGTGVDDSEVCPNGVCFLMIFYHLSGIQAHLDSLVIPASC